MRFWTQGDCLDGACHSEQAPPVLGGWLVLRSTCGRTCGDRNSPTPHEPVIFLVCFLSIVGSCQLVSLVVRMDTKEEARTKQAINHGRKQSEEAGEQSSKSCDRITIKCLLVGVVGGLRCLWVVPGTSDGARNRTPSWLSDVDTSSVNRSDLRVQEVWWCLVPMPRATADWRVKGHLRYAVYMDMQKKDGAAATKGPPSQTINPGCRRGAGHFLGLVSRAIENGESSRKGRGDPIHDEGTNEG